MESSEIDWWEVDLTPYSPLYNFWQFIDAKNDGSELYMTEWSEILIELKWRFKWWFWVVFERFNFYSFRAAYLWADFLTFGIHFLFWCDFWTWFKRIVKLLSIFAFVYHTFENGFLVFQQQWCVIKFDDISTIF